MKTAVIVLKSNTEAHKAKEYLLSRKIFCAVEKISSRRGACGNGIRIYTDAARICRMLENIGIKCLDTIVESDK